jgi:hypothetical protein
MSVGWLRLWLASREFRFHAWAGNQVSAATMGGGVVVPIQRGQEKIAKVARKPQTHTKRKGPPA